MSAIGQFAYEHVPLPASIYALAALARPHVHEYVHPLVTDRKSDAVPVRVGMVCKCGAVLDRNTF